MLKNTYTAPESVIVELGIRNLLMNISISINDSEIVDYGDNVGLVKEETYITDKSIWDEEW